MKKNILGILGLFIFISCFTAVSNENFLSAYNLQNLVKWSSLYAIMGIGVAFVIITGGIDLSIGSVIGLVASLMALMVRSEWDPAVAVLVLIGLSLGIGKTAKHVSKKDALGYILGYTCGNDMSARDWQANDLQWWRAKSSDTFTPLGPYIVTDLDPSALRLIGRINGKVVQEQVTSDLLPDVPTIMEFVTRVMTLNPGDVVMTGTPGRPDNVKEGDVMEVEIAEIGTLSNPVVNES